MSPTARPMPPSPITPSVDPAIVKGMIKVAELPRLAPTAGGEGVAVSNEISPKRKNECERMLGDGVDGVAADVRNDDPVRRASAQVDIVGAGCSHRHETKSRRSFNRLALHGRLVGNDNVSIGKSASRDDTSARSLRPKLTIRAGIRGTAIARSEEGYRDQGIRCGRAEPAIRSSCRTPLKVRSQAVANPIPAPRPTVNRC